MKTKHDKEWVKKKIGSFWPGIGKAAVEEMADRLVRGPLSDDWNLEVDGVMCEGPHFTSEHRLYIFTRMLGPVVR